MEYLTELLSIEAWALVMFAAIILLLMLGFPVAFTLGAIAMVFGILFLGIEEFQLLPLRIWGIMTNFTLLAVPLFVFMGIVLEKSGIAEELLKTMGMLFGRVRGGLAVSIVIVGTMLAATTGVVGATVVTMGIIALPALMKYGYRTELATGTIAASGTLGQIIPPSIILILLADVVGIPVGQLFAGAVVPGLMLVAGFILLILLIAWLKPTHAPVVIAQDKQDLQLGQIIKSMVPPLVLVIAVLGSIFFGIASPTESAAVGALGALLLALLRRKMLFRNFNESMRETTRMTSMVFMILLGAAAFGLVFRSMGGDSLVEEFMTDLPGGELGFLAISMLLIFVLGFFLDFLEISFIVVPILAPIADVMGVDLLWFAILIALVLQTSFLTPPFGFSLFYLKAVAPPQVKITQIYCGVVPFIIVQVLIVALVMLYPQAATWLPALMNELQGFG
jgi:tripartite ATP-independent transporter DctM subunit